MSTVIVAQQSCRLGAARCGDGFGAACWGERQATAAKKRSSSPGMSAPAGW